MLVSLVATSVISRSIPPAALGHPDASRAAQRAGKRRAVLSTVVGALSALTMPIAVGATRYSDAYELLHSAFAIPAGLALGGGAIALARSARRRNEATLRRAGGRLARAGFVLALVGIWLAGAALVALAVYGLLEYVGSRE